MQVFLFLKIQKKKKKNGNNDHIHELHSYIEKVLKSPVLAISVLNSNVNQLIKYVYSIYEMWSRPIVSK